MSEQRGTQPGEDIRFYHQHDEIVSVERARLYRAVAGAGGVAVGILHIEGETCQIYDSVNAIGSEPGRNRVACERIVPKGHVHVEVSGTFDRREGGTGSFYARVRELEAQQTPPTQTPEPAMLDFSI